MKLLPNTIINFHDIYDKPWMEKTLLLLKKCYRIVGIGEVEKFYYQQYALKNACHITFDDGDKSFYNIVFPLLKKHQIPVSIYVSPLIALQETNFWFQEIRGYEEHKVQEIIKRRRACNGPDHKTPLGALLKNMTLETIWEVINEYQRATGTVPKPGLNMTPEQLREVQSSGLVAVGAHTMNHPILKNENDDMAREEIQTSLHLLRAMINSEICAFAYPNGEPGLDFGQREIHILKSSGIKLAFSTENKTFSQNDGPLSIPRIVITHGRSKGYILLKLLLGRHWNLMTRVLKGKRETDYRKKLIKNYMRFS